MWVGLISPVESFWLRLSQWWDDSLVVFTRDQYTPLLDISGFLGVLAFSVAVFTLTGPRYKIRQATAFISFRPLFFGVLLASAVATFIIEACFLYGLRIPKFLNPNVINYIITIAIASMILYWMKICFIAPPRYSRFTANNFFRASFIYIANGSKDEMLALAREIMREAPRLIKHTPGREIHRAKSKKSVELSAVQTHAYYINSLLFDTRFCDVVAKEIPSFPAHMVETAHRMRAYDAPIHLMVRRFVIAMISNPGSALFVENE